MNKQYKQIILDRYNNLIQKDTEKNYLEILKHDEQRAEKAKQIMIKNFSEELEDDINEINRLALMASIILEEEL